MTTKLSGYSTTPGSNNASVPDGWPEGMLPGDVNACAREMMARLREWYDDPAWINRGDTATSYTASSIVVSGDQTGQYVAGRPIRLDGSSYGYVTGSAYSAPNTSVTVSGITVSATPTVMELGILSASSQMLGSVSLATLTVTGTLTVSGTTSLGTATTAVTAADGDNSTKVATTAHVYTRVAAANKVIGRAYGEYSSYQRVASLIPIDDTVPTSTEGVEIISVNYTPTSATNIIRLTGTVGGLPSVTAASVALFSGTTCVDAKIFAHSSIYGSTGLAVEFTSGTTSSTAYSMRVGVDPVGYVDINGTLAGARVFGGKSLCSLVVEEIKA